MKKLLLTLALFLPFAASSQIIGPDTVCIGTSAQFSTPHEAISYTWTHGPVNIVQPASTQTMVSNSPLLGAMTYITLNNDNGHYYSFSTNYFQNRIIKIDYGNSPLNIPTVTDMGTFGLNNGMTDGLDVVRDANGDWWAVVVGGPQMLRLSFGNSLANAPTATLWNYSANLQWPHQFILKKDGPNWMGFVANRSGSVSRFDFGNSMANTPTGVNLPLVGGISNPGNLALYKQNGNWYMLVINLIANTVTRLNFGPNLQNNTPAGTNLGNLGNLLSLPRGTSVLTDCDQQLISYTQNEGGALNRMDYSGDITNLPTTSNVINYPSGSLYNSILPFTFNGTLYYLMPHTSNTIYRMSAITYPPQTTTKYYDATYTHTFNTIGTVDLTLHCDQGFPQGPAAYCKQVVVVAGGGNISLGNDTTICGSSYTISSNLTSGSFQWNTGATTPSITVTSSGTYWVTATGGCNTGSDTINVTLLPTPNISLSNDTFICNGQSLTLQPQGVTGSPTYLWSTGSVNAAINVTQPGTYWVQVSQGICSDTDTINIGLQYPPTVNLGNDTVICQPSYTLSPVVTGATSYAWSTGATTPSIQVSNSGTYWLTVTGPCGTATDTITITLFPQLIVNIGPDTSICSGQQVTLQAQGNFLNPVMFWSNGTNGMSITANQSGTYWLQVTEGLCTTTDSVTITVLAPPLVNLGNDTSFCQGSSLVLQSSTNYNNASYLWSTGSTNQAIAVTQPGTYWLYISLLPGCDGSDTVTVTETPTPQVAINNDTALCTGASIILQSQGVFTNPTYLWSTGSTAPSTIATAPGTYWLIITENGCPGGDTMNITQAPTPFANINGIDSLCPGTTTTLQSTQPTGTTYLWSDGTTGNSMLADTGKHWLTVTNAFGCVAADTIDIYHFSPPLVALPSDTVICDGDVIFINPVYSYGTITWGNNSNDYGLQVSASGTYYIVVSNSCESVSDSMNVTTVQCDLWLPNSFTPNGDGKNDIFRLVGNLGMVTDLYFAIYNRFGERVFHTDDPYKGWDGIYRNEAQDLNTFGYMVKCKVGSRKIEMKGFLHLIR